MSAFPDRTIQRSGSALFSSAQTMEQTINIQAAAFWHLLDTDHRCALGTLNVPTATS
jgi:hypothetical protein